MEQYSAPTHLESGEGSDLILQCGDRTFSVHKTIVCDQSQFLAQSCKGSFKEAKTGVIHIPEEDPDIVVKAIQYLYTSDYDCWSCTSKEYWKDISHYKLKAQLTNVAVFALGDRWLISGLQTLAAQKFEAVGKKLHEWLPGIPEVIRAVYTTTPQSNRGLRDIIARLCGKSFDDEADILDEDEDYQPVLAELPDAYIDILKQSLLAKRWELAKAECSIDKLEYRVKDLEMDNRQLEAEFEKRMTRNCRTCCDLSD